MKSIPIATVAVVVAVSSGAADAGSNPLPSFIDPGSVQMTEYDGITDDLLSAGLNQAGLQGAAPGFADPLNPTVRELRRRAIYENYRGIVDPVPAGGMGLLWGPGSPGAPTFPAPVVSGLIPGIEYLAYAKVPAVGGNFNRVTLMVQIPQNFDLAKRCIVTAPPSGSRGVYGGIAVGEWGMFQGCAVAYGGKGSGTGFHLLGSDTVYDINGVAGPAGTVGNDAQFRVADSAKLDDFLAAHPDRVASKHAHSQYNPERHWGDFTLKSIKFALWALNEHFADAGVATFRPKNTLVIASGVSNGAGTSLRALENDDNELIDGLVVSEPSINPMLTKVTIKIGKRKFVPNGRTLYDSITVMGTYAGCAALDASLTGTPFFGAQPIGAPANALQNRCAGLRQLGLLTTDTLAEQTAEALGILRDNGYDEDEDWGIASHEWLNLWRSLQPTYAAAAGRFRVWENICNVSFAATDAGGTPVPVPDATAAILFSTSNGIPPTSGINLIADDAANGPVLEQLAQSKSTGLQDLDLDGALCFRYLATGDPNLLGTPPSIKDIRNNNRVQVGLRLQETSGNLRGVPAIVIHGRQDALVFPNIQSRAYLALNLRAEKVGSKLSYWEVTPAQHFDAFISSLWLNPVTGAQFVPLHYYLTEGLDMMYEHLTNGTPLPPSQVVRATARGTNPLTPANVPVLMPLPAQSPGADAITLSGGVLRIPQ